MRTTLIKRDFIAFASDSCEIQIGALLSVIKEETEYLSIYMDAVYAYGNSSLTFYTRSVIYRSHDNHGSQNATWGVSRIKTVFFFFN
jgi:hypothetical protein